MTFPIAEIRAFVAENRTSDALARLLDMSQGNKQIHDSILMVLAEYNDLNAQRLRGTVSSEEAVLRHNKVNEKVLMALDAFDSQGKVLPGSVLARKNAATSILLRLTFLILGAGGVLYFISRTVEGARHEVETPSMLILAVGMWTFFAYLLALVVSAYKSK